MTAGLPTIGTVRLPESGNWETSATARVNGAEADTVVVGTVWPPEAFVCTVLGTHDAAFA